MGLDSLLGRGSRPCRRIILSLLEAHSSSSKDGDLRDFSIHFGMSTGVVIFNVIVLFVI